YVTSAVLIDIEVKPSIFVLSEGLTLQLTATGIYSDHSTHDLTQVVQWTSSKPSNIAIENTAGKKGKVTALAFGDSEFTATYDSIKSNRAWIFVND
ncbi:Ig-like domain-containing protein, partial [Leptospira interrogans]